MICFFKYPNWLNFPRNRKYEIRLKNATIYSEIFTFFTADNSSSNFRLFSSRFEIVNFSVVISCCNRLSLSWSWKLSWKKKIEIETNPVPLKWSNITSITKCIVWKIAICNIYCMSLNFLQRFTILYFIINQKKCENKVTEYEYYSNRCSKKRQFEC